MAKIIKNTTASPVTVTDVGIRIAASATYTIPAQDWDIWAASIDIDTYINNGTFIINDGYDDLKIDLAKKHIHEESAPRSTSSLMLAQVQATANSTLTLTSASRLLFIFTGTIAGQIVKLPNATTLNIGYKYEVWNTSTQSIQINNDGNTPLFAIAVAQKTWAVLQDNTTSNGIWIFEANFMGGTGGGNGCLNFGYNGSAGTNRYLEVIGNNPTSGTPFIVAGTKSIRALTISSDINSTCTLTLYRNGIALDTITLTNARKNAKLNLNHLLINLDELSVRVTAGTISRPMMTVWL